MPLSPGDIYQACPALAVFVCKLASLDLGVSGGGLPSCRATDPGEDM